VAAQLHPITSSHTQRHKKVRRAPDLFWSDAFSEYFPSAAEAATAADLDRLLETVPCLSRTRLSCGGNGARVLLKFLCEGSPELPKVNTICFLF